MGHLCFFIAVVAACLLWTAALTAAAARMARGWLRSLLVAAALVVPLIPLVAALAFTGFLAFGSRPMVTNWFGPALTTFIAALVGGLWIVRAGFIRGRFSADPVAAGWPLVGLAAMFVLAKAVTWATVLTIDNSVAAQAPYLRLEAADLMQAHLPPAVADADNAAVLYQQAFTSLAGDATLKGTDSPLSGEGPDPEAPLVADLLARHASTLDAIRRAADRDGYRVARDWTRPSFAMVLPELQDLRTAARLLALAARREAGDGAPAAAIGDVIRLHRMGLHAASEPLLISGLIGMAIDRLALDTLVQILPSLQKTDLPLLDSQALRDVVATEPSLRNGLYGEEAFGLSTFADFADGTLDLTGLDPLAANRDAAPRSPLLQPLSALFRIFLVPADIACYRRIMERYQQILEKGRPYAEIKTEIDSVENDARVRNQGLLSSEILPALATATRSVAQAQARHRAAQALVAATRHRLETGSLPDALGQLVPKALAAVPRDPFTTDTPMTLRSAADSWTVYSVGPDGADDGGPPPGADRVEGNDDVGLRLSL